MLSWDDFDPELSLLELELDEGSLPASSIASAGGAAPLLPGAKQVSLFHTNWEQGQDCQGGQPINDHLLRQVGH